MAQKPSKNKHANDNHQAQISPTDRLDFLNAIAMDHRIPAKQAMASRVAVVILMHRHNQTGTIVLKHRTIADEIGCSISAVRRGADVLQEYGWFEIEPVYHGRECVANRYIPCWDQAAFLGGIWHVETRKLDKEQWGVCSVLTTPLLGNEQTPDQQGANLCSVTSNHNSGSLTRGPKPGEENSHSAGTADADRNDRDEDNAEIDHWPSDAFDQFVAIMPAYNPFDGYDDSDLAEDLRVAKIRFNQLRKSGKIGFDKLMEGVRRYAAEIERTGQCPCKPATFITGERWEDEYSTEQGSLANDNPEPAAEANDNAKLDRASGDGQSFAGQSKPVDASPAPAAEANDNQLLPDQPLKSASVECSEWPTPSRTYSTIMASGNYPPYPGESKQQEIDLVKAELEKLRGAVAFQHVLDGVRRYAIQREDQDYRKNMKFSAFLRQRLWEQQPAQDERASAAG
ncbi:hypothetical protein ACVWZL_007042 [Bradyrhizobium sp. GM2.4]